MRAELSGRRLSLPDSTVTEMLRKLMKDKLMGREIVSEEKQCLHENLPYVKSRLTNSWGKDQLFINGAGTTGYNGRLTAQMAPILHPSLHIPLAVHVSVPLRKSRLFPHSLNLGQSCRLLWSIK